ncbi:hypothetical protein ACFLWZ_01450 [Chloroflexota bacterium]
MKVNKILAVSVVFLGVTAVVLGGVILGLGLTKDAQLKEAMRFEHVSLGTESAETEGEVIDSLAEAQKAGDTIREHRRGIAPTYSDLLGEVRATPYS